MFQTLNKLIFLVGFFLGVGFFLEVFIFHCLFEKPLKY